MEYKKGDILRDCRGNRYRIYRICTCSVWVQAPFYDEDFEEWSIEDYDLPFGVADTLIKENEE